MQLHPEVQALLDAMRALEAHLNHFDDLWAGHVRRAADEVANSDAHGIERFLALFGGMGSLNDVVLQSNGKALTVENDQFDELRSKAWLLAHNLRDEIG
jgi:hypothetical protein